MSKALVIKGVDFSNNALDTVEIEIPCTKIVLSTNSLNFTTAFETKTFTYTLTPANTTEEVVVTSSDTSVCTAADGTVTIQGIGTATVTVTCGDASATITVSATTLSQDLSKLYYSTGYRTGLQLDRMRIVTGNSIVIGVPYSSGDEYQIANGETAGVSVIKIPKNCNQFVVTLSETIYNMGFMYGDYTQESSLSKVMKGISSEYINELVKTVNVPTGANCYVMDVNSDFPAENMGSIVYGNAS